MQNKKKVIFWFRKDLRISDNPGLSNAIKSGDVIPIYILDLKREDIGAASKCWLYYSLKSLNKSLKNRLNFYVGDSSTIIKNLIQKYNVDEVFWNRCYEPSSIQYDMQLKTALKEKGIKCESYNASLLLEPKKMLKSDGDPYKIYTPFYRKISQKTFRNIIDTPDDMELIKDEASTVLEDLKLLPSIDWHIKMMAHWEVGEEAALNKLMNFVDDKLKYYKEYRNYPAKNNVSKISPHLHYGEISPIQIWHTVKMKEEMGTSHDACETFLMELIWREFSYYLLFYFPHTTEKSFQPRFDNFPWQYNDEYIDAWKAGKTGIPIVDAAMRELWQTGFMHNRCRMIVASFLTKNLFQPWHVGVAWFNDCLVDADLANNINGWQWSFGSGADAAPYYRVFNPVLQGEKFDASGEYTRYYVPELKNLPDKYLFNPWEAPNELLRSAGIKLGDTYPLPIVDLKETREQALRNYKSL